MKIGYQISLYDGLPAYNTVSQQGQYNVLADLQEQGSV